MNPTPIEIISQGIIRVFHANPDKGPVAFSQHLGKAKKVLLLCPNADLLSNHSKHICDFINLFPKRGLILLLPGVESYDPENYRLQLLINHPILFSELPRQNLWTIIRSSKVKELSQRQFDLLIDLDPEFSLLNAYLCRALRIPLRIGYSKPYSKAFYNFEFEGKENTPYTKKLESLITFLKPFFH